MNELDQAISSLNKDGAQQSDKRKEIYPITMKNLFEMVETFNSSEVVRGLCMEGETVTAEILKLGSLGKDYGLVDLRFDVPPFLDDTAIYSHAECDGSVLVITYEYEVERSSYFPHQTLISRKFCIVSISSDSALTVYEFDRSKMDWLLKAGDNPLVTIYGVIKSQVRGPFVNDRMQARRWFDDFNHPPRGTTMPMSGYHYRIQTIAHSTEEAVGFAQEGSELYRELRQQSA